MKTTRETLMGQFGKARSLSKLVEIIHKNVLAHKAYQCYTTVSALEKILANQKVRLTRCSSSRLNDTRERNKYGSESVLDRTYIFCMAYGMAEQASAWQMYGARSPESVRIVFDGPSMEQWRNELRNLKSDYTENGDGSCRRQIEAADINDLIYASVGSDDQDVPTRLARGRSVFCNDMYGYITDAHEGTQAEEVSGWVKDYEWRCENETRMCVRLTQKYEGEYVYLRLPSYVINSMKITMSPWLPKVYENAFCSRVRAVWPKGVEFGSFEETKVARSSLHGALNFQ